MAELRVLNDEYTHQWRNSNWTDNSSVAMKVSQILIMDYSRPHSLELNPFWHSSLFLYRYLPYVTFLKLAASSRLSAPPSGFPKCLGLGHRLRLCTVNIYLLTYILFPCLYLLYQQCSDWSRHFTTSGVARCLRCQEAGHSDRSLLGSDISHCVVCILQQPSGLIILSVETAERCDCYISNTSG